MIRKHAPPRLSQSSILFSVCLRSPSSSKMREIEDCDFESTVCREKGRWPAATPPWGMA